MKVDWFKVFKGSMILYLVIALMTYFLYTRDTEECYHAEWPNLSVSPTMGGLNFLGAVIWPMSLPLIATLYDTNHQHFCNFGGWNPKQRS